MLNEKHFLSLRHKVATYLIFQKGDGSTAVHKLRVSGYNYYGTNNGPACAHAPMQIRT